MHAIPVRDATVVADRPDGARAAAQDGLIEGTGRRLEPHERLAVPADHVTAVAAAAYPDLGRTRRPGCQHALAAAQAAVRPRQTIPVRDAADRGEIVDAGTGDIGEVHPIGQDLGERLAVIAVGVRAADRVEGKGTACRGTCSVSCGLSFNDSDMPPRAASSSR